MRHYETVEEIIKGLDNLKYCLEHDAFEDAYQHTLSILNGLHGIEIRKRITVLQSAEDMLKSAGYTVNYTGTK